MEPPSATTFLRSKLEIEHLDKTSSWDKQNSSQTADNASLSEMMMNMCFQFSTSTIVTGEID